ncbi:competence type IV pilus minor pilin ComGF [Enterococcus xiangfangensis]|uniref:Competence type IV pilus minor pilin ComGF n=1 Tax=Enterococcus xiangfangensis TaxID=1296537 RepID=A0ABU3FAV7_9ENTE|nr:competence type IV pilus minor pilin ComGF [Enterococcus xiangfangensis]MBM7712502.1 competence protein ComGF [Enterococcus xiangfangensis]MDT2759794.1 competence type IV pilus minor pilin ComGF [Enterococcus xiangfangensis]NBK08844.1 prepilin-type N-terminal cleavage/methylation domain-containing protein [Enterococcus asini]
MPKNSGFTLLESLVALLMLSGILLLLSSLIQHAHKLEENLSSYQQIEGEIFLLQLDNEMENLQYEQTTSREIWAQTAQKEQVIIKKYQDKLIKEQSKGYQPLLTGVKQFVCQENNYGVDFVVTFTDGKQKKGTWIFE